MRHISGTSFTDNNAKKFRDLVFAEKIGYKEAKDRGLNFCFSKKQCSCGGNVRYTTCSTCVNCTNKRAKESRRTTDIDMVAVETRRRIEEIKEQSQDDYWDSLLED